MLFDYYQGELKLNINKPLYIFVSHNHYDHFNPVIFDIKHPNKKYILSNDLQTNQDALTVISHKTYTIDDIKIKTLFSTDQGVAFIVNVDGQTIYHSGDLNWWHWHEENHQFLQYQKEHYIQEINSINKKIDIACIVVDYRLEKYYLLGLEYFLKNVESRYILPIHYFGNYEISKKLQKEKPDNPYQACILEVNHQNQLFEL